MPALVNRLRNVVGLYAAPPERAVVFSCDDGGSRRVGNGGRPDGAPEAGPLVVTTNGHKANGRASLFGTLRALPAAPVQGRPTSGGRGERLRFLRTLEKRTLPDIELHFLLDSYATYTDPEVRSWLARARHATFHFLPTPTTWANVVDQLLSELAERKREGSEATCEGDLEAAIHRHFRGWAEEPSPLVWVAPPSRF